MHKVRSRDKQRGRSRDTQTVKDVACKTQRVRQRAGGDQIAELPLKYAAPSHLLANQSDKQQRGLTQQHTVRLSHSDMVAQLL